MLEVVAALIRSGDTFLICQRPEGKARALQWEFAGGKVEAGESGEAALIRECREELGVELRVHRRLADVVHRYPELQIHLTLYDAEIASGAVQKMEHRDIRWILPSEIPNYDFCPADRAFLDAVSTVFD